MNTTFLGRAESAETFLGVLEDMPDKTILIEVSPQLLAGFFGQEFESVRDGVRRTFKMEAIYLFWSNEHEHVMAEPVIFGKDHVEGT